MMVRFMVIKRMPMEEWFDTYSYGAEYDIGQSSVKNIDLKTLKIDLQDLVLSYGYHVGRPELKELVADQYDGLSSDQVVVTTGASEGNFLITLALLLEGGRLLVELPNYPPIYEVAKTLNRHVDFLPITFEEKWRPSLEKLRDLMTKKTKLVSLTHPHNPTGSMVSEKLLNELVEIVEAHDSYLLFDETYRDLAFGDPLPPAATLSDRAISLTSMSKVYGVPGIRIGWIASADKSIIESATAIKEMLTICNSAISEEISIRILQQREHFLKRAKRLAKAGFEVVDGWIKEHSDFEWVPPGGGVIGFPRFSEDVDTLEFCKLLVNKYKTFVVPGPFFEVERGFRIGYGHDIDDLKGGLQRIGQAYNELSSKAPA